MMRAPNRRPCLLLLTFCGALHPAPGLAQLPQSQAANPLIQAGAPDAAKTRAELQAVLAAMSAAVLAGDKAAYLANVDLSDPEFATEQRHWADDLDRHKPAEFILSIDDPAAEPATSRPDSPPAFTPTLAAFRVRMSYRSTIGHAAKPGGKAATWPALFIKTDPDGDGPLPARWLYQGEEWQRVSGDAGGCPFVIQHLGSPRAIKAAAEILRAFPVVKAHDDEGFGVSITRPAAHPIQIKLYDSMEHLKAWVYLSMPDENLGGWNEPGESIKFMSNYTAGLDHWTGAFAHEYGHVCTWELGPKPKNMPWWVAEGAAELAAEEFTRDREKIDRKIRSMATVSGPGGVVAWDDISDYDATAAPIKILAYHQGHHMLGYISDRWGRAGRNAWLRAMTNGKTLDEATRGALGLPFKDLDNQWRDALRAPPGAPAQPAAK